MTTAAVDRREKTVSDVLLLMAASHRVLVWAIPSKTVTNRYVFSRIEGRAERECSKNDRGAIQMIEASDRASDGKKKAGILAVLAIKTSIESRIEMDAAITTWYFVRCAPKL